MRGGRRKGAGRKKGSIRTLFQQDYDLFHLIEDRCAHLRWKRPQLYGHDFVRTEDDTWWFDEAGKPVAVWRLPARSRLVSRVCRDIARNCEISWVHDKIGKILVTSKLSARALERTYYRVRSQYEAADVEFWHQEDPPNPDYLSFRMRGLTDRWPEKDIGRILGTYPAMMSITQKIKK